MSWAQFSGYFTEKFWKDHVYEGNEDQAKRDAEEIFQRRDVNVSSVLQLGPHAIRVLVGEVTQRQDEYAGNPAGIYTSWGQYAYWERSGKRARRYGPSQFQYAVRMEGGVYKIHHFDGVV
ncbi:MAG TPA: hypothetical protein VH120_19875 [Gemmataceae bacterium]|jgi:hypothetical protein|nr:hypothetical protein [Gemmataceae bacterium]